MGKVAESPFPPDEILQLKEAVVNAAARAGISMTRKADMDMLANGDTSLFDPERRIPVSAGTLVWNVLPEALKAGKEAEDTFNRVKEDTFNRVKETHGLPNRSARQRKRAAEHRLKFKDPW